MNATESYNQRALINANPAERVRVLLEKQDTQPRSLNTLLANKVLGALPLTDFERLLPHLKPVALNAGDVLGQIEQGIAFAYFPETVIVSHLFELADGSTAEAALIGKEGVAGLSAIFGSDDRCYWTRVLIGGNALRIDRDVLKEEFGRGPALRRALLSYAGSRMKQLSQRAVCTGHHKVQQRLCCWLLMVQDRAGEDQFQLTHELMATHLGVRRAGVTVIANKLRDRHIISYRRGVVRVLNRQRLEAVACECYQMLRNKE